MLLSVLVAGCESPTDTNVTNGFTLTNAFPFSNFNTGVGLSADSLARMFGQDKACANNALPCEPTAAAQLWLDNANSLLAEGRSDGIAVTTQLFFLHKLDPNDFGAATVDQLTLDGNYKLQAELAYWDATQLVPQVAEKEQRLDARQTVDFLRKALRPGSTEAYRMAMAMQSANGLAQGHAVVPFGIYAGKTSGQFFIRVWDSNAPDKEKQITVDTKANTWKYDATIETSQPIVYGGDATNHNLLYFAPVTARLGTLPCPFCSDTTTVSTTSAGNVQVSVAGAGFEAGVKGGKIVESGDGVRVTPGFAWCPCSAGSNGFLTVQTKSADTVTIAGGLGAQGSQKGGTVSVNAPGFGILLTGFEGDPTKSDQLTFGTDASGKTTVAMTNPSGTPVNLTIVNSVGVLVTVTIPSAPSGVTVTVDATGKVSVATTGAAAGTTIDVTVTVPKNLKTTYGTGGSAQIKSDGSNDTVAIDPLGTVTASNPTLITKSSVPCKNQKLDPGETDIDCGVVCPSCGIGQGCYIDLTPMSGQPLVPTGCADGLECDVQRYSALVPNGICYLPSCSDTIKDNLETDVDCGGTTCPRKCAVGKKCLVNGDCADGSCKSNVCVTAKGIAVNINPGAPLDGLSIPLNVTLDGVSSSVAFSASNGATVGHASQSYAITFGTLPSNVTCSFLPSVGYADFGKMNSSGTLDPTSQYGILVSAKCTWSSTQLSVNVDNKITPTPGSDMGVTPGGTFGTLQLNVTRDSVPSLVSVNQANAVLGTYASSYSMSVATQPGVNQAGSSWQYTTCSVPAGYGSGTAKNTLSGFTVPLSCRSVPCASQQVCPPGSGAVDMAAPAGDMAKPVDMAAPAGDMTASRVCTLDSQCASGDCECGTKSGNCTGATGLCGAGKVTITTPTADGAATSGTFTVPASCSQVYVEAWGAAGGSSLMGGFIPIVGTPGGAGGYASGYVTTTQSDVFSVWIAEGGIAPGDNMFNATAGIGSFYGVAASGGAGDGSAIMGSAGGGGGLTSVNRTTGAAFSFSVPAGGGAGSNMPGGVAGGAGTPTTGNAGQSAPVNS
ncbi:MAG: hypothetical protein ABI321_11505, partial [Polyangia bacterium]